MITPEYNGNLSQNMEWQFDTLRSFVNAADLRTDVHIRKGNKGSDSNYVNLGQVLAYKHVGDPLDLTRSPKKPSLSETITNIDTGQAAIYVNDELLTNAVIEEGKGTFDGRLFVEKFNSLVIDGLNNVLRTEKGHMATMSTLQLIARAPGFVLPGTLGYFIARDMITNNLTDIFIQGVCNAFSNTIGLPQRNCDFSMASLPLQAFFKVAEGITLFNLWQPFSKALSRAKARVHDIVDEDDPYFNSVVDRYIPLKHFINLQQGYSHLQRHDFLVVTYNEPKQSE